MIYEPEFADQARELCRLGATDADLAEHFEVCVRTIYRWRNSHEEFARAVVIGKDHADERVERALYSRAVGCTVKRTKVFRHAGDPDPVYATYIDHLPPDARAALQWLRVRKPGTWRERREDKEKPGHLEMIEKALARVAGLEPPRCPPQSQAQPPVPEPGPAHETEPDPHPNEDGYEPAPPPPPPPPPPAPPPPPPRPIPPGFPLERVRFGYG